MPGLGRGKSGDNIKGLPIAIPFERADRKFQRGDMETVQEMGRHTERPDAECERPAGLP